MQNLIGKKFYKLTVIKEGPRSKKGVRRWECLCSCGNTVFVVTYSLIHGLSKSCGCMNREIDLTGKKFGYLKVIKRGKNIGNKKSWLCRCRCGEVVTIPANHLKMGNTKSCGCLKKETDEKNLHLLEKRKSDPEKLITNKLFNIYKRQAKKRNISFKLIFKDFKNLIKSPCAYCGAKPYNLKVVGKHIFYYNGVDRIDNSKDYTKENCMACCKICNRAKLNRDIKEFIEWAIKLGEKLQTIKAPQK